MAIEDRGFASLPPERQREIAASGGRKAHLNGTARVWNSESARAATLKGWDNQWRKKYGFTRTEVLAMSEGVV
jgi:uncharacterized protein